MPRGPGTLQTRLGKLKRLLSGEELREAEKLASDKKYEIVQYAYYIASMKRLEQIAREKIEKADRRKKRAQATLERLRSRVKQKR